jgi:glycosyltransferase involved in cell wall biosynthesis
MRVLFDYDIFQNYRYGGISRYIVELYRALRARQDMDAHLCAPFCGNEYIDSLEAEYPVIGDWSALGKLPVAKRRLRELIQRGACLGLRPDILHGTYFYRHRANFPARRFVITLHDMTNEILPGFFGNDDPMPRLKRAAAEAADHVMCISERTRLDAIALYDLPEDKFSVVHHGAIALPAPTDLPDSIAGKPYLLFVGQRGGYKNFSMLLEAFAGSRLKDDLLLVCFGGGPLTPAELQQAQSLGLPESRLQQYSGDDSSLAACYKNAAAMIYPSLYEGFGMPLLEAFSLRCPVVAGRCGAIPEVARLAIEYVDEMSTRGLANSIEAVVYDGGRADELRQLGRVRLQDFSWERCAQETTTAYQKALHARAGRG